MILIFIFKSLTLNLKDFKLFYPPFENEHKLKIERIENEHKL